jgi:hypothetical protein
VKFGRTYFFPELPELTEEGKAAYYNKHSVPGSTEEVGWRFYLKLGWFRFPAACKHLVVETYKRHQKLGNFWWAFMAAYSETQPIIPQRYWFLSEVGNYKAGTRFKSNVEENAVAKDLYSFVAVEERKYNYICLNSAIALYRLALSKEYKTFGTKLCTSSAFNLHNTILQIIDKAILPSGVFNSVKRLPVVFLAIRALDEELLDISELRELLRGNLKAGLSKMLKLAKENPKHFLIVGE